MTVRRTGEKVGGFYVYEHTTAAGLVFRWYRVEACDGAGVGVGVEWFVWPVVDGVDLDGEYLDANPLDRHYQPQPWFVDYIGSGPEVLRTPETTLPHPITMNGEG